MVTPPASAVLELGGSGGSSVTGLTLNSDAEQALVSKVNASITGMARVLVIGVNLAHLVGVRRPVGAFLLGHQSTDEKRRQVAALQRGRMVLSREL